MSVDFGRAASDYSRHRAGFPDAFFERLFAAKIVAPGDRLLDVGTGTGTIARGMAARGCRVVGLDRSRALLDEAVRLSREQELDITFVEGQAEDTGLEEDAAFDVVTAGQCWHWFDRGKAAQEAGRLLAPGGKLIIAHFDWLPLPGNMVQATEDLILKHNPKWHLGGSTGIYPKWFRDLALNGFDRIESFSFDIAAPYSHEAWRGRIRASAGIGPSLSEDAVRAFDAEHEAVLAKNFPEDPLQVPHRVFAVYGSRRPGAS